MNSEIKFQKTVKKLRHGNTHTEYRNDARSLLVEQYGIGWAVYRNNAYVASYGRLVDAMRVAMGIPA